MNSSWLIEDYIFANDFLRFFDRSFKKKRKVVFFLNLKKNGKYVFSNTALNNRYISLVTHWIEPMRTKLKMLQRCKQFFPLKLWKQIKNCSNILESNKNLKDGVFIWDGEQLEKNRNHFICLNQVLADFHKFSHWPNRWQHWVS